MADFYTVSNSMRAKDRDGNPKSWESQYGTFEVWNVYFENDDIKYQTNKKEGFGGYSKGQVVYGTKSEGQYGGRFKQEQAPEGASPQAGGSAPQHQSAQPRQGGASVESKLDYIISLLENRSQFQDNESGADKGSDTVPTDIDDGPVDLSKLDY